MEILAVLFVFRFLIEVNTSWRYRYGGMLLSMTSGRLFAFDAAEIWANWLQCRDY